MSYTPTTDFLALLRQTSGGVRVESLPGLDFVIAALSRSGLFSVSIGQTAPTSNQISTAWFKPAQPSWSAEGALYLWNAATAQYEPATMALWLAFLAPGLGGYSFQNVAAAAATVIPGTSLLAVQRAAPVATALTLPTLASQFISTRKLQIVDFSTSVTLHAITLTTPDGATIMQRNSLRLQSTADSLASVMLTPSPDLNSWIIAP
jgi:hypothetical protein